MSCTLDTQCLLYHPHNILSRSAGRHSCILAANDILPMMCKKLLSWSWIVTLMNGVVAALFPFRSSPRKRHFRDKVCFLHDYIYPTQIQRIIPPRKTLRKPHFLLKVDGVSSRNSN